MAACALAGSLVLAIAAPAFGLQWTHSVEKQPWRERWRVQGDALVLVEARVSGSGAGMEPPEGSVWQRGEWVYTADRQVAELNLAVSGATGSGWQLCLDGAACVDLEAALTPPGGPAPEAITLRAGDCPRGAAQRPLTPRP